MRLGESATTASTGSTMMSVPWVCPADGCVCAAVDQQAKSQQPTKHADLKRVCPSVFR
jgi:hypothetical protein